MFTEPYKQAAKNVKSPATRKPLDGQVVGPVETDLRAPDQRRELSRDPRLRGDGQFWKADSEASTKEIRYDADTQPVDAEEVSRVADSGQRLGAEITKPNHAVAARHAAAIEKAAAKPGLPPLLIVDENLHMVAALLTTAVALILAAAPFFLTGAFAVGSVGAWLMWATAVAAGAWAYVNFRESKRLLAIYEMVKVRGGYRHNDVPSLVAP